MPPRTRRCKEEVEVRNQADQMVYQSREDPERDGRQDPRRARRAQVQAGIDKLKETLKGTDTDAIKAATEELTQAFYADQREAVSAGQAPRAAPAGPDMGGQQAGGDRSGGQQYYDADYKVVDDDDQNNK